MLQPEITGTSEQPSKAWLGWLALFASKYGEAKPVVAPAQRTEVKRRYAKPAGYSKYTYADVAQHNQPDDAWLIIEDKVYDVSGMAHPGGDVIFSYAGRDASELFNVMHKNQPLTRAVMKAYLIGEVAKPERSALLKDFDNMLQGFVQQGFMTAQPLYYTRKIMELVALVTAATYLNTVFPTSWAALVTASVIMGAFFWQAGWTQHDLNHNQVFRSHKLNGMLGGWVIGFFMGGSAHWWKTKHNQHHATPNKMDHDNTTAMDPDIDTVPLIAWSEALLKQVNLPDRGIIAIQHVLVWPMLLIALVNWQMQSIIHLLQYPTVTPKVRRYELGMIIIHHTAVLALSFYPLGFARGLAFWVLSHCVGGFVTSFVFIQSHNAMEIYTDDLDFVTSQMVSTRNINPGVVADWIMGGLNYQIEHHLFPTMPRHSFSRVRKDIMQFCARHGLPYESCTIWESSYKVYLQLKAIAKLA